MTWMIESLLKFAINTKVEVTVNILENKSSIKNNFVKLKRLFNKGKWSANYRNSCQVLYLSKKSVAQSKIQ